MEERKTPEDQFRDALMEAQAVLYKLAPLCNSMEEALDLIKKAVGDEQQSGNAALLRLLMKQVLGTSKR